MSFYTCFSPLLSTAGNLFSLGILESEPTLTTRSTYSDKWWVYPFLDWRQGPVTAGWYLGIGAAFIVVFFVQYLFHLLRDWIAKKVHRYHGKEDVDTTQQMTEPAA